MTILSALAQTLPMPPQRVRIRHSRLVHAVEVMERYTFASPVVGVAGIDGDGLFKSGQRLLKAP
jgi:hypothetical protein